MRLKPMGQLYHFERSQIIAIPRAETFAFFANPKHLEAITPEFVHFKFLRPPPSELHGGSVISYRIRILGVPIRWQSVIESWEPPARFVDLQVKGPYSYWRHVHEFEDVGEHRTRSNDRIDFALPMGPLGKIAHKLFVARMLNQIFDFRAERLSAIVGAATPANPGAAPAAQV
ncbi:MAG TPA: SRPBCC family protein [Candidatus Binataceae bacterium]|nr:SRPBCC family protein [Candidatus Binataceae bacterium]